MEEAKGQKRCINNSPVARISVRAAGEAGRKFTLRILRDVRLPTILFSPGSHGRARSKASRMQIMERSTLAFN